MTTRNSGFLKSIFSEGRMAIFWWLADGEQGVGGAAGIKKEGMAATDAYGC